MALLALGELPCCDEHSGVEPIQQPWYRAYSVLKDACARGRLATLGTELRWLVVDALLACCEFDPRHDVLQAATGWVSSAFSRSASADLSAEPALRATVLRLSRLAARDFSGDGAGFGETYDDGRYELTFAELAAHAQPASGAELRLVHAYLTLAGGDTSAMNRAPLHVALEDARLLGIDVARVRDACASIVGAMGEELPSP